MKDILARVREGLRFEAKAAAGGLPKSLWETYSSFANTEGGVIVLGAAEREDGSLDVAGVENPEQLVKTFWDTINNRAKTSLNILSDRDVSIETHEDKRVIVIRVPRAGRTERPIFLNRDMLGGTYRRNGEGDYRCSESEVRAMVRDADAKSQDLKVLPWATVADLNLETVHRYRNRMQSCRPGHVWLDLEDESFLRRLGALAYDENGTLHVTCAGLLMFGNEYDIVREFPKYFLDYQERFSTEDRWSDRVISSSGEWSGNVYDFYFRVYNKIAQTLKVPFKLVGQDRIDDTPVHKAIREVMVNCVVNADYRLPQGVVVIRDRASLTLSNPGSFRVPVETARSGGLSDPRNETILKMFTLIDIGERAGSGIPSIEATWERMRWKKMDISESNEPARVMIKLELLDAEPVNEVNGSVKGAKVVQSVGQSDQNPTRSRPKPDQNPTRTRPEALSALPQSCCQVYDAIANDNRVTYREMAELLGLNKDTINEAVQTLLSQGLLQREGPKKGGQWILNDKVQ